ncbi:MAG: cysteine hydrolase [Alphaproteobacteria bacterium]|nr:cysteine hydrolase [Alphaproteobacteria bacterium]
MKNKKHLTVVDFQNDFVSPNGALTFDNGKGDKNLIQRVADFFRQLPIGYFAHATVTLDTHNEDTYFQTQEGKLFPIHCVEGSHGWHLAIPSDLITSKIADIQFLRKNTYDMWEATIDSVKAHMTNTAQEVVLFGVASDICNKAALKGWLDRGHHVTVLEDLTRGIFKQTAEVVQEEPFKTAIQHGHLRITTARKFLERIYQRG